MVDAAEGDLADVAGGVDRRVLQEARDGERGEGRDAGQLDIRLEVPARPALRAGDRELVERERVDGVVAPGHVEPLDGGERGDGLLALEAVVLHAAELDRRLGRVIRQERAEDESRVADQIPERRGLESAAEGDEPVEIHQPERGGSEGGGGVEIVEPEMRLPLADERIERGLQVRAADFQIEHPGGALRDVPVAVPLERERDERVDVPRDAVVLGEFQHRASPRDRAVLDREVPELIHQRVLVAQPRHIVVGEAPELIHGIERRDFGQDAIDRRFDVHQLRWNADDLRDDRAFARRERECLGWERREQDVRSVERRAVGVCAQAGLREVELHLHIPLEVRRAAVGHADLHRALVARHHQRLESIARHTGDEVRRERHGEGVAHRHPARIDTSDDHIRHTCAARVGEAQRRAGHRGLQQGGRRRRPVLENLRRVGDARAHAGDHHGVGDPHELVLGRDVVEVGIAHHVAALERDLPEGPVDLLAQVELSELRDPIHHVHAREHIAEDCVALRRAAGRHSEDRRVIRCVDEPLARRRVRVAADLAHGDRPAGIGQRILVVQVHPGRDV